MPDPYSPLKILHHTARLEQLRHGEQIPPSQIELVLSDLCNQDCSFCAYRISGYPSSELFVERQADGRINRNPKRIMAIAKAREIISDAAALGIGAIQFTGGGEPTVNPQHPEAFRHALNCGHQIALVTNGMVLRDEALAVLKDAAWIRVSLDAGHPITYGQIRRTDPGNFYRVLRNVERLAEKKSDSTLLGVDYVITRENWREVAEGCRMAREHGANNFRMAAVFTVDGLEYHVTFCDQATALAAHTKAFYETDAFQVFNHYPSRVADLRAGKPNYQICHYQQWRTYIGADLNVYRCCAQSYSKRGLLGSLKNQRLADFWLSTAKHEAIDNFDARGCHQCPFNDKNHLLKYALEKDPLHVTFV